MSDKQYRDEMNRVKFSEDFTKRTAERVKEELGMNVKPRRRWVRPAAALAACLAVVLLTVTLYPQFRPAVDNLVVEPTPAATAYINVTPHPTAIPTSLATAIAAAVLEKTLAEEPDGMDYEADALFDAVYEIEAAPMPMAMFSAGSSLYRVPEAFNTSEFSYIQENRFLRALDTPLSTFSASVDKASFTNVRGMIERDETVPADAVRVEEFVNYFHYDYPRPKDGEPFSITTELAPCPWNSETMLLMIGLATDPIETENIPRSNLVFLIDVSGSMDEPDRLPLVQKAFLMLTEQLREDDIVSIVTYAGSDWVVLDGVSGKEKRKIADAIESLSAYGSTAGADGINTAYDIAWKHFLKDGNNRVILATDGDLNVGVTSEGELIRLIEEKKETGVFLSVVGVGYGNYKDNKLEALAIHGKGNYNYINDTYDAKRVFVEEMGANLFTVCKDAKIQVEFNPAKVSEYRLIGYESRKMDAIDFANDKKDGGQIGAGHQVTAMYEIVLADGGDRAESGLRYQKVETTDSQEYLTVSIRTKKPDSDVSDEYVYPVGGESMRTELSDNMAIAAAAVEFGMILRDSEFKGSATYQSAADLLKGIDVTEDPYKDDFAYMLRKLARQE